jgi:hypothetical protein
MKSTKIEDIDIPPNDPVNVVEDIEDIDINEELRVQLADLKSELHDIKSIKPITRETIPVSALKKETVENLPQTYAEKLNSISFDEIKDFIVMMLLYILLNSTKCNDFIDNIIPFSIYAYAFIIKSCIFAIIYKLLQGFI